MDDNSCQPEEKGKIDLNESSAHAVDHDVGETLENVLNVEMKKMTVLDTKSEEEASEVTGSGNLEENFCHSARTLTEEEITKLRRDVTCVSDFKQNKLEREAQRNWDLFYKRNTTKFFKDRHWTKREFDELCPMESEVLKCFIVQKINDE
jgi:hypothetical protein